MKLEAPIVVGSSITVAGSSLIFYAILTAHADATLMASLITAAAAASMVQIAVVPNTMIFVYSAGTQKSREDAVFYAAMFELIGIAIGATSLGLGAIFLPNGSAVLLAFLGYGMAGSTSAIGYIRADRKWAFYVIAYVLPSALRLMLLMVDLGRGNVPSELYEIVRRYFLIPELARYAIVMPPIFIRSLRFPRRSRLQRALRTVFHNWIFDLGSALVEVGDRLILSAIVTPKLLVLYFFARRLGAAATIVLEPFYAINFKSFVNSIEGNRNSRDLMNVLIKGYLIGGFMALFVWGILSLAPHTVPTSIRFIPAFTTEYPFAFPAVMLIDSVIAANRWSRYISLLDGRTFTLLGWRFFCLSLFVLVTWSCSGGNEEVGLVVGFACFALVEHHFVSRKVASIRSAT